MPLTDKQRKELNEAILCYLKKYEFKDAYNAFKKEAKVEEPEKQSSTSDLEYKWGAVIRLQADKYKLQKELSETQKELKEAKPIEYSDFVGSKKLYNEKIPNKVKYKFKGHGKAINYVKFHPTYSWIITCADTNKIGVWDYDTGKLVKWLYGHKDPVNCASFNKQGTLLVTGSKDTQIKLWDFSDEFINVKTFNGHENSVTGITFCKNDIFILSSSRDGIVKLWEINTGFCKQTFSETHDEWIKSIIVSNDDTLFATCSVDQTIKIFDLKNGNELITLKGHDHVVECILFSNPNLDNLIDMTPNKSYNFNIQQNNNNNNNIKNSNNKNIELKKDDNNEDDDEYDEINKNKILQPKYIISGSRDKTIKIWNIKNGTCIFSLIGHDNWIHGLSLMSNGRFLFSVSDDQSIRIWDLNKRKQFWIIEKAHSGFLTCVDWHPTACLLVTGATSNDVKLWHHSTEFNYSNTKINVNNNSNHINEQ